MSHRLKKLLVIGMLGIVIGMIFFVPDTFATNATADLTPEKDTFQIFYEALGVILNLIYITTLPLLMIAGKAMDNSMVYGEFINLDKPLYMLRNISRTFANFAIGGVFLYNIIRYIFTPTADSNPTDVKNIVMKSAAAALGINFSWFVIGALLDLSTILTYSLGAMPLSVLNQFSATQGNMPILSVNSFFNYESLEQTSKNPSGKLQNHMYYQRGNINISPCGIDGKLYKGFVTGPKYSGILSGKNSVSFDVACGGAPDCKKYCAIDTMELADITALEKWKKDKLESEIDKNNSKDEATQYNELVKQIIGELSANKCNGDSVTFTGDSVTFTGGVNNQPITVSGLSGFVSVLPSTNSTTKFCNGSYISTGYNITNDPSHPDSRKQSFLPAGDNKPYSEQNGLSMVKLLDQSRGMVGVFVTLYMTLLDFSNISLNDNSNTTVTSSVGGITEFVMRAVIGILLLLPLVALSVTLIMRIGILRGLIAFAPLGVAAFALFDMKGGGEGLLKNINLKSILGIIFAPIVPVFVLSISIIFIQALHRNMNDDLGKEQNAWSFMGMQFTKQAEKNTTCADFWGLQQLCYKTNDDLPGGSVFANLFPRLFVNIFSIAIMRFLVKMSFAASPLTAGAAEGIMNIGGKLLGSIPLIPIPGLGRQGINTVAKLPSAISNVGNNIGDYYNRKSDAAIDRMGDTIQEAMGIKEKTATPASTISSYTPPAKVTNFNKGSELTNHLGLNNGGTLNTTNATTEKIEKLVNNDGKEKIITGSTTSEKSDQIIGILNDMFEGSSIIDQQKQLTYKSIFNEGLSPYISDKTSGTIKEESKNAITGFLNSPNIQKMLNLDTNDKISEGILKKINYKDKDNKTFKLEKGTGTTYTRTSS